MTPEEIRTEIALVDADLQTKTAELQDAQAACNSLFDEVSELQRERDRLGHLIDREIVSRLRADPSKTFEAIGREMDRLVEVERRER